MPPQVPLNVLVIDDDPLEGLHLGTLLKEAGCLPVVMLSPADAERRFAVGLLPDLAVLDPGLLLGGEVAWLATLQEAGVPVLMLPLGERGDSRRLDLREVLAPERLQAFARLCSPGPGT